MNHRASLGTVWGLVVLLGGCGPGPTPQSGTDAPETAAVDIVANVRAAIAAQDLGRADEILQEFRSTHNSSPEAPEAPVIIEALSWLGRGALAAKEFDLADRYATETYTAAVAALASRSLAEDTHLQTALGASIETQALVGVERGARSDAVIFLRGELDKYQGTPIHKRIAKNLNLLSLEGQPAPALEGAEHLDRPVPTFAELKGKVVLLFFWAHWCPDCKAEGPIIARLLDKYGDGLTLVAPTQRYGYVAGGTPAPPDEELKYIVQIRDTYYEFLRDQPVPVSETNHQQYGVSSTPTLVLLDREGVVRMYHPGGMTEEELDGRIRTLLGRATS